MTENKSGKPTGAAAEAALKLAMVQAREILASVDAARLARECQQDTAQYAHLVNALARLSEAGLKYQKHRAEVKERKAQAKRNSARKKPGGVSPETLAQIEEELKLL